MIGRKLTATLGALAFVAIPATPSQAFCHLFGRCAKPTTTFYAPVAPVVAAPVCAQPQIVNYMPQTAYRAVIVNRPVVSYMPQAACDPCGRATTVMRPVTSFVAQQQLVPYTTFRPVVMPVAQPCCGATPVAVSYAPAAPVAAPACCGATPAPTLSSYSPAPVAAPAPACCGSTPTPSLSSYSPAPTTTTIIQPSTVTAMPAPPAGTPGSTLQSLQPTPDPSLNNGTYQPSTPQQSQTFAPNGNGANGTNNGNNTNGTNGTNGGAAVEPQSRVLLPPYSNNGPSNPTSSSLNDRPRGLDPDDSDRTTAIPLRGGVVVRQASLIVPVKAEAKPITTQPLDDSGWRAAGE